ncbi:hypothetical protein [Coleofasciculus sp. E1-EBD-02]|uniref:hypothetical protein n=1 Tax=Coleofasciculus sp. E1-EBD-02 TaxID=3068481 RepID=UPI0032F7DF88
MKPLPSQVDTCNIAETTAQQALAEFGITQLLSFVKDYSDIDFEASQMHLTDAEVHAIAKLLIQQLTESLNGKLIAGALNTLRHGEEIEEIEPMSEEDQNDQNLYCYPTPSRLRIAPLSVHSPTGRYNPQWQNYPRPITQREQYIINLYCYCELGMTPKQFYAKWDVTYEQLSHICSRSQGTVQNWFNRGKGYHPPQPVDLRHLTIMDFLLEHFEEIPQSLINLLCSS